MGKKEIKPLPKVSCFDTDCENNLHCFGPPKHHPGNRTGGTCNTCGIDLVDWPRIQKRDINDINETINSLRKEFVRHEFWHVEIIEGLKESTLKKEEEVIRQEIRKRIKNSIFNKRSEIFRDGTQTPMNKHNIIYFAQHATATCCRKCMKYWYEIPFERELTLEEVEYFEDLIYKYIEIRMLEVNDYDTI